MDLNFDSPEKIKALIQALQNLLPDEDIKEEKKPESKIKTKTTRIPKKSQQKNKFLDMPELNMFKSDSDIDKKLAKFPPTPRTRQFKPISVTCRVCGKKEKINPALLPDSVERYKCNLCSSSAGG